MDPSESGAHAATVYRDRRTGKAINLADEAARIEAERAKKAQEAREQFEWGRGTKQKEAEADARAELKAVANEPFARRADDPKLEKMRRDVIRDGDPMADYIRQSRAQEEEKATPSESRRPAIRVRRRRRTASASGRATAGTASTGATAGNRSFRTTPRTRSA